MYKMVYGDIPETHMNGKVVFVEDETGANVGVCFKNQLEAFDYIKTELEKDEEYKKYINNPGDFVMELYRKLNDSEKKLIQKSLVQKYRNKCMFKYYNK